MTLLSEGTNTFKSPPELLVPDQRIDCDLQRERIAAGAGWAVEIICLTPYPTYSALRAVKLPLGGVIVKETALETSVDAEVDAASMACGGKGLLCVT